MDTLERMPFKARKAVFDKLLEVADVANLSKDERILYDEALKRYRDYKNTIDYAEEKGVEKGISKVRGAPENFADNQNSENQTIFNPIMETIKVVIKNNRPKVAGSWKKRIPTNTVPTAPIPVHTG